MKSLTPQRFEPSPRPLPEHIARGHPPSQAPSRDVEFAVLASLFTLSVTLLSVAVVLLAFVHLLP